MMKLVKRRQASIKALADFTATTPRPSSHKFSFRAKEKMNKKTYNAVAVKTKFYFAEKYAKAYHGFKSDVSDTFKAITMVVRYINALTEKIEALVEELGDEYNSEAWNASIHDKRLKLDNLKGVTGARSYGMAVEGRGRAKAKAKAQVRGARGGRPAGTSTPPEISGEVTPPIRQPAGELPNFSQLDVKGFKGPWSVICGDMTAEAVVDEKGVFDMHQKVNRGQPAGWSAYRCKIIRDSSVRAFVTDIDGSLWRMAEADLDPAGKSVVIWEGNQGGYNLQSIWTRTRKGYVPDVQWSGGQAPPRPKPKAKTQARRVGSAPRTPPSSEAGSGTPTGGSAEAGRASGANSPNPVATEWYTEIRDGKLMWTDGISAVPAEERVADDSRQKTKMQF